MIGQPANDLTAYGSLLVRRAVLRDDWIAEAIFDLASADRTDWTPQQWDTLLKELTESSLTIEQWLTLYD